MLFKRQDIAIDLGTATVLIYVLGKGIVLREPSVVAIDNETGKAVGVGYEAQRMIGRAPDSITVSRPLRDGVISDCDITQQMLELFMRKAMPHKSLFRPRIIVCVPSGVTDVEQRSVLGAASKLGAKNAFIMEEAKAAAIGANIDIEQPCGTMVVDIGGGTTDIAVLSLGNAVISTSIKIAGNNMDEAIIKYIRRKHNLLIGERTAEMLKINIGSAYPRRESLSSEVMGRSLVTGLPKSVVITSEEVSEALQECFDGILAQMHVVFEQTPPELAADIIESGIVLTGGGAMMFGIDKMFSSAFGINCYVADDAISCVALGAGKCLKNLDYADPYEPDQI